MAALCQLKSRQAVVAERFGVSVAFIKKLLAHERQTGSLAPQPASGGRARYLDAQAQHWFVAYVGEHPDSTLAELSQAWQAQGGRPVGQTCLWQVLQEHDLRRKKSLHASERDTPRVVALRQDFMETVAQHYDTRRFHLLDETGLRLDAGRRYARARAPGGQRVGPAVPLRRGPTLHAYRYAFGPGPWGGATL